MSILKNEKCLIYFRSALAAAAFILLSIPAFGMTGAVVKPLLLCVAGSVIICFGILFSHKPEKVVSLSLLYLMLFWLVYALIKQFILQTEAGFVFEWIYFFYFDKLLILGTIWLTAVLFYNIKRLLSKTGREYRDFFRYSGTAFVIFYIFLLVYSFVLIRLEKGDYPINLQPLSTIREYINDYASIPYEVFMMFFGNLLYFTPLGYIFSVFFKSKPKAVKFTVNLVFPILAFSLLELSQYLFQNGFCEIDDMLMNTIGFWFGNLLCSISNKAAVLISKGRCTTFWG